MQNEEQNKIKEEYIDLYTKKWDTTKSSNNKSNLNFMNNKKIAYNSASDVKKHVINQSVAILCDGNNIEKSIHEVSKTKNAMINFDAVIPKLLNGRGLNRLLYFREGKSISSKFAERLHENYYGSVIPCHKSADIPLTIKATQLASKVDTIIIMSGDSDYIDLVSHLKGEGVRVEIAAVKRTASRVLIDEADYFHEIIKEDWFIYKAPMKYIKRTNILPQK